jgi:hypothetical protein
MAEVEVMGSYADTASSGPDLGADGVYSDGSYETTAITQKEANPWWRIDLGEVHEVHKLKIFNRNTYHTGRLKNFTVRFYDVNNDEIAGTAYPVSGTVAESIEIHRYVSGAKYVEIKLNGTDYLQLGEVEVTGIPMSALPTELANVALDKTASQSSDYGTYYASKAINGNDGDTQITGRELKPWWEVDLEGDYDLTRVKITNRGSYQSRLKNFDVFYYDAARNEIASYYYPYAVGANVTLPLAGENVRHVRVQLRGTEYLHMAEVEVLGLP